MAVLSNIWVNTGTVLSQQREIAKGEPRVSVLYLNMDTITADSFLTKRDNKEVDDLFDSVGDWFRAEESTPIFVLRRIFLTVSLRNRKR